MLEQIQTMIRTQPMLVILFVLMAAAVVFGAWDFFHVVPRNVG